MKKKNKETCSKKIFEHSKIFNRCYDKCLDILLNNCPYYVSQITFTKKQEAIEYLNKTGALK